MTPWLTVQEFMNVVGISIGGRLRVERKVLDSEAFRNCMNKVWISFIQAVTWLALVGQTEMSTMTEFLSASSWVKEAIVVFRYTAIQKAYGASLPLKWGNWSHAAIGSLQGKDLASRSLLTPPIRYHMALKAIHCQLDQGQWMQPMPLVPSFPSMAEIGIPGSHNVDSDPYS